MIYATNSNPDRSHSSTHLYPSRLMNTYNLYSRRLFRQDNPTHYRSSFLCLSLEHRTRSHKYRFILSIRQENIIYLACILDRYVLNLGKRNITPPLIELSQNGQNGREGILTIPPNLPKRKTILFISNGIHKLP